MKKIFLLFVVLSFAFSVNAESEELTLIWKDTAIPGTITVIFVNYENGRQYYIPITFNFTWDRLFYSEPRYNKIIIHMPHNPHIECLGVFSTDEVYEQVDAIAHQNRNYYLTNYINIPTYPASEEETE